jgi:hypothetical protein
MTKTTVGHSPKDVAAHRASWVAALRSGEYQQITNKLRTFLDEVLDADNGYDDFDQVPDEVRNDLSQSAFCCLGVAECVIGRPWIYREDNDDTPFVVSSVVDELTDAQLTVETTDWLGLTLQDPYVVVWDEGNQHWTGVSLSVLNDGGLDDDDGEWSFAQIADAIESQPADWNGSDEWANHRVDELNITRVRP